MAIGTTAAILLGLGGAAGGFGASKLMSKGVGQASSPSPLPQPPSITDASGKAEAIVRAKRASMSQTVYTSPLGVGGTAEVTKKTLLGQ